MSGVATAQTFENYRAEFLREFKSATGKEFFATGDNGDIEHWHGVGYPIAQAVGIAKELGKPPANDFFGGRRTVLTDDDSEALLDCADTAG